MPFGWSKNTTLVSKIVQNVLFLIKKRKKLLHISQNTLPLQRISKETAKQTTFKRDNSNNKFNLKKTKRL